MEKSLLNLFSVPILTINNFINDIEKEYLLSEVKKQKHTKHPAFTDASFSTHRSGINFLNEVNSFDLVNRVTNAINQFGYEYGIGKLKLTSSWSNIQNKGSKLIDHMHPNSKISGCIYLNVDENSSKIYFHNPNPYVIFEEFNYTTPYNHHYYWMHPENNQLILFPSWLKHGSNQDQNNTECRVSIAFNSDIF